MVRLVAGVDGSTVVDGQGKAPGRGAYLCAREECFEQGRRRIAGALRGARIDLPSLRQQFAAALEARERIGEMST